MKKGELAHQRPSFRFPVGLILVPMTLLMLSGRASSQEPGDDAAEQWRWEQLPGFPAELGVAGPFVGVHQHGLLVAGGTNFPEPVWENDKVWRDAIWVLPLGKDSAGWVSGGSLPRSLAHGATVSTDQGVLCIGGHDGQDCRTEVFELRWDPATQQVLREELPALPEPSAFAAAALIGQTVYLVGGQTDSSLDSAHGRLWTLDLSQRNHPSNFQWQSGPDCPGPARALHLVTVQHNGYDDAVYVISGRGPGQDGIDFLRDVWEFVPRTQTWRQRSDAPRCVMAGTGIARGQSHVLVLSGDDGSNFHRADELKDDHPGFLREGLLYHTITDRWVSTGAIPANQVTTPAVVYGNEILLASGEVRPRVRSRDVWRISHVEKAREFGAINYTVLLVYLLSLVGIGVYFSRKNTNTDDFFRGGQQIPWWAAGCSIFATMLSSLTFTGLPAKAFAQDWVYAVGNLMIAAVAVVAVYIALPFYRRIDATSAYEYLEKRFNRSVRLFGSASFGLFHVFRMAVIMSLTGLAVAVATPLTPTQSVLLMGVLSILYCTMGGIEAVIWTDTLQTFVLLGGAIFALVLLVMQAEGGMNGFFETAMSADKFRLTNLHWDPTAAQLALWVVILGGLGQNLSSYTADQAIVQRYMTTSSEKLAARSIWLNAFLSIPATFLFFGIGTALYVYYQAHPEKLDPSIMGDQTFPFFIANEMPVGVAGLIVAGIFAAAQSTISTSMNSIATTVVTDFLRPMNAFRSENAYFRSAQVLTMGFGLVGTLLGLVFINPEIRSLFETFMKVIGLFMGVLGGLFLLGVLTKQANARGAMLGACVGAAAMFWLWQMTEINGYLYTTCGIVICFIVGYVASLASGGNDRDLSGLTLWTQTATEN